MALGAIAAVVLLAASAAAVQIDRDPAPIGVVADGTGTETTEPEPAPDHEPQPEATSTTTEAPPTTAAAEPTTDTSADDEAPPTTEPAPGDVDHGAPLWGRSFASVQVTEGGQPRELYPGTRIELTFDEPRRGARWNAGCNLFGAEVAITAERIELTGHIAGTTGGCRYDHDQEDWLASFMASGPYWALDGDRLTLTSGDTVIEMQEAPPERQHP